MIFATYALLLRQLRSAPRLVLAGLSLPTREDWQYAESLGLANQIEVHQGLVQDQLAALYRNAAAFVLSSDEEGFGLVILEAMASGIPVVSTRCGGVVTAIIDGTMGFLVPIGDVAALASRVKELIEMPHRRFAMGRAGRWLVVARFGKAAAIAHFVRTYEAILSNGLDSGA